MIRHANKERSVALVLLLSNTALWITLMDSKEKLVWLSSLSVRATKKKSSITKSGAPTSAKTLLLKTASSVNANMKRDVNLIFKTVLSRKILYFTVFRIKLTAVLLRWSKETARCVTMRPTRKPRTVLLYVMDS